MTDFRGRCITRIGQRLDMGTYQLDTSPAEHVEQDRFFGVWASAWRSWSLEDERGSVSVRIYYRPVR